MSTTGTDLSLYTNWPPYPSYSDWELTKVNDIAGSEEHEIDADQLPASQWSIRYNPFSDEVDIGGYVPPASFLPTFAWIGSIYRTIGTISSSYQSWLLTGNSTLVDISGAGGQPSYSGIIPPTLDYQFADNFKEVLHYGMEGLFSCQVTSTGAVSFISMESFFAYMEFLARCRMKPFRIERANILTSSFVEVDSNADWEFTLNTTLSNNRSDIIDTHSDNITGTIFPVDANGIVDGSTVTVSVDKIIGKEITVTMAPVANTTAEEVSAGWGASYISFNKVVFLEDPLMLYAERKADTSNIAGNDYVYESADGYETREQSVKSSGGVTGIYIAKAAMIAYIEKSLTVVTSSDLTDDLAYAQSEDLEELESASAFYVPFEGTPAEVDRAKRFLGYMSNFDTKPSTIILHVGIGGGVTRRHNMHAGCLTNDYFITQDGGESTYRISNHIRNGIYSVETNSKTSSLNLLDHLSDTNVTISDISFETHASRMWLFNDICSNNSKTSGSCDRALFWGEITTTPLNFNTTNGVAQTSFELKLGSNFWDYGDRDFLKNRFVQNVSSSNNNFIEKWDKFGNWKLNDINGTKSYDIFSVEESTVSSDSFKIKIYGTFTVADLPLNILEWWISFDEKFEIANGFGYVTAPYVAMSGVLAGDNDNQGGFTKVIFNGLYVGLPLRESAPDGDALTVVVENSGIYPNIETPPSIYFSSGKTGEYLFLGKNESSESLRLLYRRKNDQGQALVVRSGRLGFEYENNETPIYYGDAETTNSNVSVSGSAGATITIDSGNNIIDNDIIGISGKRTANSAPVAVNGSFPNIIWQLFHDGYPLGYPSTSGKRVTLYSRTVGSPPPYVEEDVTDVPLYKSGLMYSVAIKSNYDIYVTSDIQDENITDPSLIKFVPIEGVANSPIIEAPEITMVNKSNVIKNATNPFVYESDIGMDVFMFIKNQGWLQAVDGGSSFVNINNFSILRPGSHPIQGCDPTASLEDLDMSQDGLFIIKSDGGLASFSSGIFSKNDTAVSNTPVGGISTPTVKDLYRIPNLVISNITRCAYSANGDIVNVVGYSNLRESLNSEFDILALVFHEVRLVDANEAPIYLASGGIGSVSNPLFTYSSHEREYKRVIVEKPAYEETISDAHLFVDPGLELGAISLATEGSISIIMLQNGNTLSYLASVDGSNWAYFDDLFLLSNSENVSSPSIQVINDYLWIFYMLNRSDLYLKKVPMSDVLELYEATENNKSSLVAGNPYQILKSSLQINIDGYSTIFVATIPNQQVSFVKDDNDTIFLAYRNANNQAAAISSLDYGDTWDFNPVNF